MTFRTADESLTSSDFGSAGSPPKIGPPAVIARRATNEPQALAAIRG